MLKEEVEKDLAMAEKNIEEFKRLLTNSKHSKFGSTPQNIL
jgi:hypothetical protein